MSSRPRGLTGRVLSLVCAGVVAAGLGSASLVPASAAADDPVPFPGVCPAPEDRGVEGTVRGTLGEQAYDNLLENRDEVAALLEAGLDAIDAEWDKWEPALQEAEAITGTSTGGLGARRDLVAEWLADEQQRLADEDAEPTEDVERVAELVELIDGAYAEALRLHDELWDDLEEYLGPLPYDGYDSPVFAIVREGLACLDVDDTGSAPVATPVPARADFTG
ncbi:hypothetical protein [Aquipuribacter nitratireducens]|uniref:Uncharacterized protein n=1 Tax=Aquipuribacter nitratireducens TaxID=650104 RepID=A0ABW0GN30_9MICO